MRPQTCMNASTDTEGPLTSKTTGTVANAVDEYTLGVGTITCKGSTSGSHPPRRAAVRWC